MICGCSIGWPGYTTFRAAAPMPDHSIPVMAQRLQGFTPTSNSPPIYRPCVVSLYRRLRTIGTTGGASAAWRLPSTSNPCRSYNGIVWGRGWQQFLVVSIHCCIFWI
jgi:hypothetical protein